MAFSIVDQGDGTVLISDSGNPSFSIVDQGDGTVLISGETVVDQGDGTVLVTAALAVAMAGAGSMGVAPATTRFGAVAMAGVGSMGVIPTPGTVQTGAVAMHGTGSMAVTDPVVGALFTATAQPDNLPPRVELDLSGFTGATTVTVMRIDSSGNQTAVRSFDPKTLTGGGAVDYDQDAPFLETVTYIATPNTGAAVTSNPVTVLVYEPWLFHATIPTLSCPLSEISRGNRTHATGRGIQYAIGRPGAVPTSDGTRRAPTYDLTLRTDDLDAEKAINTLLADSSVLLLQGAFEGQTRTIYQWIDVGDVDEADLIGGFPDDPYLQWTFPVAVTDPPVGTIQAQRTLGDIYAEFDTLGDVFAAYNSMRDVITDTLVGT